MSHSIRFKAFLDKKKDFSVRLIRFDAFVVGLRLAFFEKTFSVERFKYCGHFEAIFFLCDLEIFCEHDFFFIDFSMIANF